MASHPRRLLASIDIGTNSIKLTLAYTTTLTPSPLLLPILRLSSPFSPSSLPLSLSDFSLLLSSLPFPSPPLRAVATASLRGRRNPLPSSPFPIRILSGDQEARLTHLAVLLSLPLPLPIPLLTLDIGGGSTELLLGINSHVLFSASLDLGHVTLTDLFKKSRTKNVLVDMRSYVRAVLDSSGVVEQIKEIGFEVAVGSSGTVKAVEKAISTGKGVTKRWRFTCEELQTLVEKMEREYELLGVKGIKKLGFGKRRAESAMAGAVILREVFEAVGIEEMQVSGFALGEGVIAEMMMEEEEEEKSEFLEGEMELSESSSRWRSVVWLATRFGCGGGGDDDLMELAVGIAKDIFDSIRRCLMDIFDDEVRGVLVSLEEQDLEYVEAGILLRNVGRVFGKKKYHKVSYKIIKNCGHLHGYSSEEIELIALLARFHRKQFPTSQHASLQELPVEITKKFRVLCIITRLSLGLQQLPCTISQGLKVVHTTDGFKLLLHCQGSEWTSSAIEESLRVELKQFEEVLKQKLSVIIS